jgi:helix-hairpin-helix protein
MTDAARDLLAALLLCATVALALRASWPAPSIGSVAPVAGCAIPVERAGEGVRCLAAAEAARLGVRAGDRIAGDGKVERMEPVRLELYGAPVDVNRASPEELASLPGIGPGLAARIVARRPFTSLSALGDVPGIGPRRLRAMASRVALGDAPAGMEPARPPRETAAPH